MTADHWRLSARLRPTPPSGKTGLQAGRSSEPSIGPPCGPHPFSEGHALREEEAVADQIRVHPPSELSVSTITLAERRRSRRLRRLIEAFVGDVAVVPFDDESADRFGKVAATLVSKGTPIGTFNVMIAAHALQLGLTLVTHNLSISGVCADSSLRTGFSRGPSRGRAGAGAAQQATRVVGESELGHAFAGGAVEALPVLADHVTRGVVAVGDAPRSRGGEGFGNDVGPQRFFVLQGFEADVGGEVDAVLLEQVPEGERPPTSPSSAT